jgi:predicted PurR-regulated permease PerM
MKSEPRPISPTQPAAAPAGLTHTAPATLPLPSEPRITSNPLARPNGKSLANSLRILVICAVGTLLYFAHVAFVPVALALLFSLVLSGPVEFLHSWRVPRSLSAAFIMAAIIGALIALGNFIYEPAQQWFASAPHTIKLIEKKVRPFEQLMARLDSLKTSAGSIGSAPHAGGSNPPPPPAPSGNAEESAPVMLFDATRGAVLSLATVLILSLFLLAGGPPMLARMASVFVNGVKSAHIVKVIENVRREVGRFYVTSALINIGLGLATALAMMACGLPNPFLWGTLAAVLNFIPYAGPLTTLAVLSIVALVSFDGLPRVFAVAGSYAALVAVEGQVIQPLLVGRRLQLNPMLVFLALWFGGLFWGIAGIILATPALAAFKVIASHSRSGAPLLDFLSPHSEEEDDQLEDSDVFTSIP